jgi:hypothetical protein
MEVIQDPEENYTTGYVSLFRSFINWEWFTVPNMVTIFIYCLLKSNFKDKSWRGINIKRGSFITSIDTIAKETNLTKQQVRTCLKKLEKTKEIVKQSNTRNTQITICKYDSYQRNLDKPNTPPNTLATHQQHTDNTPITTTNNYNKDNNDNKDNIYISLEEKIDRFLKWFNSKKEKATGNKSNIKQLSKSATNNLKELSKKYDADDFNRAISQLFKNKWARDNSGFTPNHFLVIDNFTRYLAKADDSDLEKPLHEMNGTERGRYLAKIMKNK